MGTTPDHAPPEGRARELERALARHAERFVELFGGARPRTFFSPGRVNLMGAHLDYNGGPVAPMAIDRGTYFAVRARSDRRVRLASNSEPGVLETSLDRLPAVRTARWFDYPLGVLRQLAAQGRASAGLDLYFGGDLPVGAGLSSSASICVGSAFVFDAVWGLGLQARERVALALVAEREFVGVRCGIMDPYAVGLARPGHILWLDCKDEQFEHLPLDHQRHCVAVADTLVRRELAQSAFNQRVAEAAEAFERLRPYAPQARVLRDIPAQVLAAHERELAPELARRARHVVEEVERTFDARAALLAGDERRFGAQMFAAHRSLRELYEVSAPELDCLVDAAQLERAVCGARLTGAGFGGCVVMLLERDGAEAALESVAQRFDERFGRRPAVQIFGPDAGPREL
ncbi:MAG: galactokinase [Planctomycetes bacterium]|nr:galactokinase [Planctomycetota bacterium]